MNGDLTSLIRDVAFPVVVAFYLLTVTTKRLEALDRALLELSAKMEGYFKALQEFEGIKDASRDRE